MRPPTRRVTLAAALVLLTVTAPAARGDGDEPTGDLKKIQGAWTHTNGQGGEDRWVFEGDTLRASINGQNYVSKVKLDPKAQPEPTADFKITEAPDDSAGQTALGIYKIDGDTLKLCIALPGIATRPAEFKRVEGEAFFITLQRAK